MLDFCKIVRDKSSIMKGIENSLKILQGTIIFRSKMLKSNKEFGGER